MRNIGERIRSLRTEKQLTLPALAERASLSKGLLSKLENDQESNTSLSTLYSLAEALDVTIADILETEQAQVTRVVPESRPAWLKELVDYLDSQGKKPDEDILTALYFLRNRKAGKNAGVEHWKFVYQSIENSFKR
jgi:transcriptional regulator with XRE-family HTH domain